MQGCLDVGCIALSLGLSTLPTGVALTGDGHWQVGLEGVSLRVRQLGGSSKWGSSAQVWECPWTQADMSPKPLFTLGRVWMAEVTHPAPKRLAVNISPSRDHGITVCLEEGVSGLPTPAGTLHSTTRPVPHSPPPGQLQHPRLASRRAPLPGRIDERAA